MQDAAFEVGSNIIAAERLEDNTESRRQGADSSSSSDPNIDILTKMIELLASEVSILETE